MRLCVIWGSLQMRLAFRAACVALVLGFAAAGLVLNWPFYGESEGLAAYQHGDYSAAVRLWRQAAEQGDAHAQHNLGLLYRDGHGVAKDINEAARWFRLAAEQGLTQAQVNLGVLYAAGQGVPPNDDEASRWFRLAADKGDEFAQYNLAYLLRGGRTK